jgi:hypothetical protein
MPGFLIKNSVSSALLPERLLTISVSGVFETTSKPDAHFVSHVI